MTEYRYRITCRASEHYLHAEVGPIDGEGRFIFGETAEVYVSETLGALSDKVEIAHAEVGMGAIGAHSPERALRRLKSYGAAIALAERIDWRVAEGVSLEQMAVLIDGTDVGEVRLS